MTSSTSFAVAAIRPSGDWTILQPCTDANAAHLLRAKLTIRETGDARFGIAERIGAGAYRLIEETELDDVEEA